MIGFTFKFEDTTQRVVKAADRAAFRNFGHAAAGIRKTAQSKIVRRPAATKVIGRVTRSKLGRFKKRTRKVQVPSRPGSPPFTRRGQLRRAIVFAANKEEAVIGPRASVVGQAGEPHEHGGMFKGERFPKRSFMSPSLQENLSRFHRSWAGSVRE